MSRRIGFVRVVSVLVTTVILGQMGGPLPATAQPDQPRQQAAREEIERLRTATSKTFRNADGTATTEISSGAVHYLDGDGRWRDIESELEPAAADGYAWQNAGNSFRASFRDRMTAGFMRFGVGAQIFSITADGASPSASAVSARAARSEGTDEAPETPAPSAAPAPTVSASAAPSPSASPSSTPPVEAEPEEEDLSGRQALVYDGAFPGVDVEYRLLPDGVKETLILDDASAPARYRFYLEAIRDAAVDVRRLANGGWAFYVEPDPEPAFVVSPAIAYDSGAAQHGSDPHASVDVKKVGGRYAVDLAVDTQWLHHPDREFPVYLDPTISIQPPSLDANFIANCSTCTPVDFETMWIGTDADTWRGAYKFDLSALPPGATVTDAQLKTYYTGECVTVTGYTCGSTSHQLNAHEITSNWSLTTTTAGLAFGGTSLSSFTLPVGATPQWMSWGLTQTVQRWLSGASPNYGVLLKRATEPANASGPDSPSRNYFEPTIRPKLEVTYSGYVKLLDPDTLHSSGAELDWTRFEESGFTGYEVHRGTAVTFTPSAASLLTTIDDVTTTSYVDTTAAPNASFTYKIVAGGQTSNGVTVTLPANGQSKKVLQPAAAGGDATAIAKFSTSTSCANYGSEQSLYFGTTSTSVWRSLLAFDLRDVPTTATVTSADLSLWHPGTVAGDHTVAAHRVTVPWREGTGLSTCTGDGATWYETEGGVRWNAQGGDFDPTPVDSERDWDEPPETDVFNLTSAAQKWVSGQAPNYGILLKRSDETLVDNRRFAYYSDDQGIAPSLRPKLTMTYTDGGSAQGPVVSVQSPQRDGTVAGATVKIVANASDDRRVDKVEFLVDGAVVATDTAAPWETVWNSTTVANGTRNLSVRGTDDAGNVTTSTATPVKVANSAKPTTSITAPAAAASVKATVSVTANAADDQGVTKVEFLVDGLLVGEDTVAPYAYSWNTLAGGNVTYDGAHTLTSRAWDAHGQSTTSSGVNVTVTNTTATKYRAGFTATTAVPLTMASDPVAATQAAYPVKLTFKNNSTAAWTAADLQIVYQWFDPAGTLVSTTAQAFGTTNLAAGATTPAITVNVRPPKLADGVDRAQYQLRFDLKEISTTALFAAKGNKPLEHPVLINKALKANALGFERYYHYTGAAAGAGMGHLVNVANGNSLLRWTPLMAPGRGLATVVDMTYNSLEAKNDSPIGNNFSLAISSLTRLGLPLDVHPNSADTIAGRANKWIEFTDGDGTTHRFNGNAGGGWDEPPGVHLFLREYSTTDPARKWALTRPDRTTFFYDTEGYPTSVEDKNGNRIVFTLEAVPAGEDPGGFKKRVTKVTDSAGVLDAAPNRSFTIDYYSKAEAHKPQVRGKIQTISDHNGSVLAFDYYDDGNLLRVTQRGGTNADGSALADRSFVFTYTTSDGSGPAIPLATDRVTPNPKTPSQSNRLFSVRDPRGKETTFAYFGPTSAQDRWKLKTVTDRAGKTTSFAYDNVLTKTTVTAPLSRVSAFDYDANGRVVQIVNPKNETTDVAWTPDFHVSKVTEANGANTQYTYNANGYLTELKAMDRNNVQITGTQLVYTNLAVKAENGAADVRDASTFWKAGRTIPHLSQIERRVDGRNNAWVFQHDANGNVTKVIEPEPASLPEGSRYATTYAWNTGAANRGTLASVTDQRQKTTTFSTYDANGLPTKIVDPLGNTTRLGHTDDGLLSWVQDPEHLRYEVAGHTDAQARDYRSYFYYDSFHRLGRQSTPKSTQHDRGNLIWTGAAYDANDNVVTTIAPAYGAGDPGTGARTTTGYDEMDRPVAVTTPEQHRTELAYDDAGRLKQVTRPLGVATPSISADYAASFDYDALDRIVTETRHKVEGGAIAESLRTHTCYDNVGNVTSVTSPRANRATVTCGATGAAESHTTKFTYDDAHRRLTVTDPLGHVRRMSYDANGNVTSTTDADTRVTTMDYDARNLLTRSIQPFEETAGRKVKAAYRYDASGNLVKTISPRAWDASPDAEPDKQTFSRYVTTVTYDDAGRVERVELPFSNVLAEEQSFQQHYVHSKYDKNGRLLRTSLPVSSAAPPADGDASWTVLSYFDPGWIKTSAAAPNPTVHFDYLAEGLQSSRVPEVKGRPGVKNEDRRMGWTYYRDGQLESRVDQDGGAVTYRYDVHENVTSVTDNSGVSGTEKGIAVISQYDSLDRLSAVLHRKEASPTDTDGYTVTEYAYDLNGNVVSRREDATRASQTATSAGGKSSTFTYDAADWLDVQIDKGPVDGPCTDDRKIDNDFTNNGWEQQRALYKATTACTTDPATAWQLDQTTNWTYFQNGKLDTLVTKKRDTAGVMKVMESHDLSYLSDQGIYVNGHRTKDVYWVNGPDAAAPCRSTSPCTRKFVYDQRDRLVKEDNGHGGISTFTLDPLGNVTREASPSGTVDYAYLANQLASTSSGGAVTSRFFYDDYGNLDCVTKPAGTRADCSKSAQDVPASTVTSDYAYDALDRLANFRSYSPTGNSTSDYSYDGLDRVTKQVEDHAGTINDRATEFLYQGLSALVTKEVVGSTSKAFTYDAYGSRVAMQHQKTTGTDRYTYGHDVQGSVSLLLNDSGGAKASYGYTAYGKNDGAVSVGDEDAAAPLNPFRFTADRFDSGSGSIDMGARRFGPDTGRFLQLDVFHGSMSDLALGVDPLTQNRYAFAGGNPVSFVELDGHVAIDGSGGGAVPAEEPVKTDHPETLGLQLAREGMQGEAAPPAPPPVDVAPRNPVRAGYSHARELLTTVDKGGPADTRSLGFREAREMTMGPWLNGRRMLPTTWGYQPCEDMGDEGSTRDYMSGKACPPPGFPYNPIVKMTASGPLALDPQNDGCSGAPETGKSYDFTDACLAHDYGYDLLRNGDVDFDMYDVNGVMHDATDDYCNTHEGLIDRLRCRDWSDIYWGVLQGATAVKYGNLLADPHGGDISVFPDEKTVVSW